MAVLIDGSLAPGIKAAAVIMAGGSGTRFWPLSRGKRPKQYLPLGGGPRSLIQETAARLEKVTGPGSILVVTSAAQRDIVREQLPDCCILAEPCGRNTAPCVALAAQYLLETVGDVPMICVPADHLISGEEEISAVFRRGLDLAAGDRLITIGIVPTKPETGYGYIRCAVESPENRGQGLAVLEFVEKPSLEKARQYVASGDFYWNSGMFIWRSSVIMLAIERFLPQVAGKIRTVLRQSASGETWDAVSESYRAITPVSIDVGVMERAENALMLPGDGFRWSDIGSWSSWAENAVERAELSGALDESGNYFQGDAVVINSSGCAISGGRRIIAAVGLKDLIIVDTDDALLVCSREGDQDVRSVVDQLRRRGREDLI